MLPLFDVAGNEFVDSFFGFDFTAMKKRISKIKIQLDSLKILQQLAYFLMMMTKSM